MLNYIWLALMLGAVLIGGFSGRMKEVGDGAIKGAGTSVTIALGLIGTMALWLGVMRLADKSGMVQVLARVLSPILRWLFPDVPKEHPAMGSMVMNMAANMLGLNNAATPLGLRAMKDLETLNPHPGTATNAMCTFLAINTSSIQLIPITAVGVLVTAGSKNPFAIIGTALLATICSTIAGVTAVKLLQNWPMFRIKSEPAQRTQEAAETPQDAQETSAPLPMAKRLVLLGLALCFGWFFYLAVANAPADGSPLWVRAINGVSLLAIPFLLSFIPAFAMLKQIKVYEEFVAGAKEGFDVAVRIIPYLVTILTAVTMFREAGGIEMLTSALRPMLDIVRYPAELLPITLIRPLSGSGAFALFSELVKAHGPDSLIVRMAGTLYGSTETTFYVLAVYFGSVAIQRTRHALAAGLIADGVGSIAAVIVCRAVFR